MMPDSTVDSMTNTNVSMSAFEKGNSSQQNRHEDHNLLPQHQPSSSDSSTAF